MRFEESERVHTGLNEGEVLDIVLRAFMRVSEAAKISKTQIEISDVNATFGSINRSAKGKISLEEIHGGFNVVADVRYRPSVLFWVFFFFGLLFYGIGCLVPTAFYLWHKRIVRSTVRSTLERAGDDISVASSRGGNVLNTQKNSTDELIKLAALKERGHISEEEFLESKNRLLGSR
jgi:hypothetical protein